jgi:hypothetical protein
LSRKKEDEVEKTLNDKPFEFHTSDGAVFTCERSDLSTPIEVRGIAVNLNAERNLSTTLRAVAEMIAYHRGEVWPHLHGFAGYDCLVFVEEEGNAADESELGFGTEGALGKGDGD